MRQLTAQALQAPKRILMVRPAAFGFNPETFASNPFQQLNADTGVDRTAEVGKQEFDGMTAMLRAHDVLVDVFEDTAVPRKPDACFPNNWVSTFPDGTVTVFPIMCENRRLEVRQDVVDFLRESGGSGSVLDWTGFVNNGQFLEGTGSIVFDHYRKLAYGCRSPRTNEHLFNKLADEIGYRAIMFNACDPSGVPVYHTNVIMSVGSGWNLIAEEYVERGAERDALMEALTSDHQRSFFLTHDAVSKFSGNCMEVQTSSSDRNALIISASGWASMPEEARQFLEDRLTICAADLSTLENVSGGSARCMVAGVYY